ELVFPNGDTYKTLSHFFIPADGLEEREKRDRVPYRVWVQQGFITATPGETIDYDVVRAHIDRAGSLYKLKELAFDPWGAYEMAQKLDKSGVTVIPVRQNFENMSPPTKELAKLVLDKSVEHGNNPVLRWMADNVVVIQDENENVRPSKKRSKQRIDGMTALILALGRAQRHEGGSVYDEREVRVLG
ncbi:MAG TPA: terminase TerL endonuclease subunit, partial [Chloroflexota bacterium]|nr:terminase TerL endonuclease subunit [Chloroflexota bacterium]